jgi:hypothetical protein
VSAVQAGVSTLKIKSQTGHAIDAMLARYVRDGELFVHTTRRARCCELLTDQRIPFKSRPACGVARC